MIFLVENICLNFFPFQQASMLPVQGLLFWFRCDMGHPCLVFCHNMAQHAVSFLVIAHQNFQSTCNTVYCAPRWASWAPIVHTLSDNPNDYSQCHRVLKIWGKCRDRSDIVKLLSSRTLSLTLTHQIIIHQRWTPTSRLIVHVLSSYIKHPNPFPNHAVTHRIVTIHDSSGDESHSVAHS